MLKALTRQVDESGVYIVRPKPLRTHKKRKSSRGGDFCVLGGLISYLIGSIAG